jgi:3-hydroxymyristoyl/3-hydroxydecanoyl-(acyl carrier protein) dehydratase
MDGHFRAFSFVDRITALEPGRAVAGEYSIPATAGPFSHSLVAEAIGQLAAWAAMAHCRFALRPVAGIAKRVEFFGHALPGQTLTLNATLESVDDTAVAYGGAARLNGREILRLSQCVGPMLPAGDFDDPELVGRRFELLHAQGAEPGAYGGLPEFELMPAGGEPAQWLGAHLCIPEHAPFFSDHFPRRPIFPGTLLVHNQLRLADALANNLPAPAPGGRWEAREVCDVKIRSFTLPGTRLDLEARVKELAGTRALISLQSRNGPRLIGTARVALEWSPAA